MTLIVDDGSTDGTAHRIATRKGRFPIEILTGDGTWWWGGSVWRAFQQLKGTVQPSDFVFLANNDTLLDPDYLAHLHETATGHQGSVVGGRSFEIWPDGTRHPVSSGFLIDHDSLSVLALDGEVSDLREVDALAGRGILIPYTALSDVTMHPKLMPQHFADLHLTCQMKANEYALLVDHRAQSLQIDRASSARELGRPNKVSFNKASPMYFPALTTFWWLQTPPMKRPALPWKALRRLGGSAARK